MSDPIKTTVVRYKCPFCNRHESRKATAVAHIARCWSNPDNKTCRTCALFVPATFDSPEQCDLGIDLPGDAPVVNCPEWGDAEQARWEGVAFGGCGPVLGVTS
jgi:hypothetical protein